MGKGKKPASNAAAWAFEALEPRLLLSADPLAAAIGAGLAVDVLEEPGDAEIDREGLERLFATSPAREYWTEGAASTPPPIDAGALAGLLANTADSQDDAVDAIQVEVLVEHDGSDAAPRRELVFIDTGVSDYEQLLAGLGKGREFEVVFLDPDRNGINQISGVLAKTSDPVDAIHIISHGTVQGIQIGDTWLTQESLSSRANTLAQWGQFLSDDADLLLYGCNLAGSEQGRALVDELAVLTGADVAASEDATGAAILGGDWELEYQRGFVETSIALSPGAQTSFATVLDGTALWSENGAAVPGANTFDGVSFGTETNTANVGGPWLIMAGAEAPTRDEKIVVGVDSGQNLSGQMWNGTSWSALPFNDFATVGSSDNWGFDVAYESQSGHALLVYDNGAGGLDSLSYRTWDGSTWSGPVTVSLPETGKPEQMRLAADPLSDEMVLVVSNEDNRDYALVWDGSSWGNAVNLHNGGSVTANTEVAVAYEQQSGHAMIIWAGNEARARYKIWDGSSWSVEQILVEPAGVSGDVVWTAAAADPNSDRIALGVNTDNNENWLAVWDGDAWGSLAVGSNSPHIDRQAVAVAFESGTGEALAAYATSADTVRYQTWTAGGGWSGELDGPDLGLDHHPDSLTLDADPDSNTIMLSVVDKQKSVTFAAWNGTTWVSQTELETDAGTNTGQPFLFLWDQGPASGNTPPTLTTFAAPVDITDENTEVEITFADLEAEGDEDDSDGTVGAFVVKSVASGTLKIGASAGTASPFAVGSNDTINAANNAYWTPAPGANGTLNAFAVVAEDDMGAESISPVTATVAVAANPVVNDQGFSVDENALNGTPVGTIAATASDPGHNYSKLYWVDVDTDELRRIELDGTGNEQLAIQTDATAATGPRSVAVDDVNGKVYWTNNNTGEIWRANLDGSSAAPVLTGPASPIGIAVDPSGGKIYWFDAAANELWRADFDGSNAAALITTGISDPKALAIDAAGGKVYWTNNGSSPGLGEIRRANLDGSNIETVTSGLDDPYSIALDTVRGKVYWAESGLQEIHRADMAAGVGAEKVVVGLGEPRAVAVDSLRGKLYWADAGTDRIERANLDGTSIEFLTGTGQWPVSIALGPPVQNLTYAITGGNTNGAFALDPVTGEITVANSTELDFETTPAFNLAVSVTDAGGRTDNATITVDLNNLNDNAPVITSDGGGPTAAIAIDENTTAVTDVDATDADGTTPTYDFGGGADDGFFTIDNVTGVLAFSAAPDFETAADANGDNVYEVIVEARDGINITQQAISVSINNLNDNAPVITSDGGGPTAAIAIDENTTVVTDVDATDADGTTPTYDFGGGADDGFFTIDNVTGVLAFSAAPDFETAADANGDNVYEVVVEARDGANTTQQAISVSINDLNDNAPVITSNGGGPTAAIAIDENTTAVTDVDATDADGTTPTYGFGGGADDAFFTIDNVTGVLSFIAAPDFETVLDENFDNVYEVVVEARDGVNITQQAISVSINDLAENSPVINNAITTVAEDAANATVVYDVNDANTGNDTDLDSEPLSYNIIGGNTDNIFGIDSATGVISVVDNTNLDFETTPQYILTVAASDGTNTDTADITIDVTNVNDAPVLGNNNLTLSDGDSPVLSGAELSATDVDDPDPGLTFTVSNVTGGQFELVSSPGVAITSFLQSQLTGGQVRFVHAGGNAVPAFEVAVSDGALSDGPSPASITFIPVVTPPPTPVGDPIDPPGPPSPPDPTPDPDIDLGDDPEPEPEPEPEEEPAAETEEDVEAEGTADPEAEAPAVLAPEPTLEQEPSDGNDRRDSGPSARMSLQSILRAIAVGPTELKKILGLDANSDWAGNSFSFLLESDGFVDGLDELRDEVSKAALLDKTMVASTVAVSSGLSVGYVVWLVRGGVLMSTMLSSLPAWRLIDPLPVLAYMNRSDEDDEESDREESLESIVEGKDARPDVEASDDENHPDAP